MTGHRYWKFDVVPAGGVYTDAAELHLLDAIGGTPFIPVAHNGGGDVAFLYDLNPATLWHDFNPPGTAPAFDYGTDINPLQLSIQAPDDGALVGRTPVSGVLYYSDTSLSGPWTEKTPFSVTPGFSASEVKTFDIPVVSTPEIRATAARFQLTVVEDPYIRINKLVVQAVYNLPTAAINITKANFQPVVQSDPEMRVTKTSFQVVCRGRVDQPRIKVWTFTLDGHDFYVLQLQRETLVYDFSTEQWHVWGTGTTPIWRAIHGIDWKANIGAVLSSLGGQNISSVLVGDELTGALYFLAPEQAEDDYTDTARLGRTYPFMRVVHGQLTHRGRDVYTLNGILLTGSVGNINTASNLTVNLSYSNDRGNSYHDAGDVTITPGTYDTRVEWRSLGSVKQPGRLFKITDYGALVRIDGLDIPDVS